MKKLFYFLAFAAGTLLFVQCNDDDDPYRPVSSVREAFEAQYPNAVDVQWEQDGNWEIAGFRNNGYYTEAWYSSSAVWNMTVTNYTTEQLPSAVKNAYESGEYSDWGIDYIERVERKDLETVFVLQVDEPNGNKELDLYYTTGRVFLKAMDDLYSKDHKKYLPISYPAAIGTTLSSTYPNAGIYDVVRNGNYYDVLLLDGTTLREARFNSSGNWVYTQTEVTYNQVPAAVRTAIESSEYADYTINSIYHYMNSETEYYQFEMQSGSDVVEVIVLPEGTIQG